MLKAYTCGWGRRTNYNNSQVQAHHTMDLKYLSLNLDDVKRGGTLEYMYHLSCVSNLVGTD